MLRHFRSYLSILVIVLLNSCTSNLVSAPKKADIYSSQQQLKASTELEQWKQQWDILCSKDASAEERQAALKIYNKHLLDFMRGLRWNLSEAIEYKKEYRSHGFVINHDGTTDNLQNLTQIYNDLVPAEDIKIKSLDEHYVIRGLGVPVVGVIPASKKEAAGVSYAIRTKGTARTLTAVMDFSGEQPHLRLFPRHTTEHYKLGHYTYDLAADFSASLEVYWRLTDASQWRLLGLLRPQRLLNFVGLSCIERYDPDRIPVILSHGLASTPQTFNQLVNRLYTNAYIRRNYQFWYFTYPSGLSWVLCAAEFRKALNSLRDEVDPERKNKNWDKKVLVGHSMGGLINHFNQTTNPWMLLDGLIEESVAEKYLNEEYIEKPFRIADYEPMRSVYFFRPVTAGRVVYLATPHKGAPAASYYITGLLNKIIKLPQSLVEESLKMVTLQRNIILLEPSRLKEWFFSSDQLSPTSDSIRGLQNLTVQKVPTHSIIGDKGDNDTPYSSDGLVPYWSSHIPWGTEHIVPSSHSVQDHEKTAEHLKDFLMDYLRELRID